MSIVPSVYLIFLLSLISYLLPATCPFDFAYLDIEF